MSKFMRFLGPALALALLGIAASSRFIDYGFGHATTLALAGGVFTIALAVYIRD